MKPSECSGDHASAERHESGPCTNCTCPPDKAEKGTGVLHWRNALRGITHIFQPKPKATAATALNMDAVDALIEKQIHKGRGLIELMQDVSEHFNYLPPEALQHISVRMNVPLSRIYSIATFYQDFKLTPQGRNRMVICTGTACHVKGAAGIVDVLCRVLNLKPGETSADGKITLSTVNCIGLCGVGPVAILNGEYQRQLTAEKSLKLVKSL